MPTNNKPNRLIAEKSPYLLQHDIPVDWFPWGEEAFEKAKHETSRF
ncbi:peptidase M14, carboxypeptidase A [Bacillus tequilensis]|nr:peptidase M14, carboxypeptidase A [Bacillus tequilensis]